jgi:hypothetical protein
MPSLLKIFVKELSPFHHLQDVAKAPHFFARAGLFVAEGYSDQIEGPYAYYSMMQLFTLLGQWKPIYIVNTLISRPT